MTVSDSFKRRLWYTAMPVLLCICFIASSLLFLVQMVKKSQEENIEYLYNAAEQKKISIEKQIEGDLQTLQGLAIILGGMEDTSQENLMPILKEINEENAFIQMGYARLNGEAWLVDLEGEVYQRDLNGMKFFQEALKGNDNISDIFADEIKEDYYVNYYGVGITDETGEIEGVLCAVHSADVLRRILDSPVLSGEGFSNIVDGDGNYILRSINAVQADILPENKVLVEKAVGEGGTADFIMVDRKQRNQMAVIMPLLEDRWYLLSMVPQDVLRARYIETVLGIMVIIVVACCLFALFIFRQRSMTLRNQKVLMRLAYIDSLTGLSNADGFKLEAEPVLAGDGLSSYVLWYGDLKNFKFINDILGYEEGDKILKLIAGWLHGIENKDRIVCRVSADNFAGISRYESEEEIIKHMDSIQGYLRESGVEGQSFIEFSVGLYRFCPGDEKISLDILMNYANMARKTAKEKPGNAYAFYDSNIRNQQIEDSKLEAEADKAIENGEFKVYMQPKVDIQENNRLAGAEVLVRWQSPAKGLIPPGRFIPLFEKNDRIVTLDRYMFEQTCRWFRRYLSEGGRLISIAVNVSKVGLLRKDFIEYYSEVKERYRIPDGLLELEFTEGVMLNDTDMFSEIVLKLKERGFICSLDDFGSGYSSLNLLKDLPIDVLKLDIMFFHKSRDLNRERIVISNFVHLAKELKIKTIAEGVEDVDSVDFLKDSGCDVVQGYVFFRPMPLDEFECLVREQGDDPLIPKDVQR